MNADTLIRDLDALGLHVELVDGNPCLRGPDDQRDARDHCGPQGQPAGHHRPPRPRPARRIVLLKAGDHGPAARVLWEGGAGQEVAKARELVASGRVAAEWRKGEAWVRYFWCGVAR